MTDLRFGFSVARWDQFVRSLGWQGFTPWWLATLDRFMSSGRRRLVVRVGRRGTKSSALVRLAVGWALHVGRLGVVPPGDRGYVSFLSVSREEAAARLATIRELLTAAHIPHTSRGDTIDLDSMRTGFKVLTASVAGVSGWTTILIIADEMAKWVDVERSANPAREVIASVSPTGASLDAPEILSSSAWTTDTFHEECFSLGDSPEQMTASAPTWIANPSLTESALRKREPDPRIFDREYGAIPQPSVLDGYLADVIRDCVDVGRTTAEPRSGVAYTVAIDPAWRRDEFAAAVLHGGVVADSDPRVVVDVVTGWRARDGEPLSVELTIDRLAELCGRWGTWDVYTDQASYDPLRALCARRGICLIGVPWTSANKAAKFRRFRSLALDRRVALPDEPQTIAQLESIAIRSTPSGGETFEGRGSADDRAFAVVLGSDQVIASMEAEAARPRLKPETLQDMFTVRTLDETPIDFTIPITTF